ncbi:MAG TPA: adenylate/guanylate cyclase domain-containing protein [Mycobacteriales bacterium]|nr:adenylate/guanylate cyclase domain-containing protein [Mycobacteriales bacterium]
MTKPAREIGPAELESALLGGERRYTRQQVAEITGVAPPESRRLWRAMGFADVEDDAVVFTDGDIDALRTVLELSEDNLIDERTRIAMTRALGQSLARLADWQLGELDVLLNERAEPPSAEQALAIAQRLVPIMERLLVYVWRRKLAAAAGRALAASTDELSPGQLVVGFADLVGFTDVTRQLDEDGLAVLVDRFESVSSDVVAQIGGRIVKTVGDEVLFVTDDPAAAAEIALRLVEEMAADPVLPPVRAGLARGTVLTRLGDVYGSVVNIASRLTSLARSDTVLVDLELAAALADDERFDLRPMRRRSVGGYEHLAPTRLRRRPAAP